MKNLLWITDALLDHLSATAENAWFKKLTNARADHTGISELRAELATFQRTGLFVFDPGYQSRALELAEGVYLCGSGGWGDASAGCANAVAMALNDEFFIADLKTRNLMREEIGRGKCQTPAMSARNCAAEQFLRDCAHACSSLARGNLARGKKK